MTCCNHLGSPLRQTYHCGKESRLILVPFLHIAQFSALLVLTSLRRVRSRLHDSRWHLSFEDVHSLVDISSPHQCVTPPTSDGYPVSLFCSSSFPAYITWVDIHFLFTLWQSSKEACQRILDITVFYMAYRISDIPCTCPNHIRTGNSRLGRGPPAELPAGCPLLIEPDDALCHSLPKM